MFFLSSFFILFIFQNNCNLFFPSHQSQTLPFIYSVIFTIIATILQCNHSRSMYCRRFGSVEKLDFDKNNINNSCHILKVIPFFVVAKYDIGKRVVFSSTVKYNFLLNISKRKDHLGFLNFLKYITYVFNFYFVSLSR